MVAVNETSDVLRTRITVPFDDMGIVADGATVTNLLDDIQLEHDAGGLDLEIRPDGNAQGGFVVLRVAGNPTARHFEYGLKEVLT